MRIPHRRDEGFTLIELVVLVFCLTAIAGVCLYGYAIYSQGEKLQTVTKSITSVSNALAVGVKNNGTITYDGATVTVTVPNSTPIIVATVPDTQLLILPDNGPRPLTDTTAITDVPLANADWCVSAPNPRRGANVQANNKASFINKETTSCY